MVICSKKTLQYIFILTFFFSSLLFLLSSCNNKKEQNQENIIRNSNIHYAKGFSIEYFEKYTMVNVKNPWDTTQFLQQYILIDKHKPQPESLPQGKIIKIPVESIGCFYSIDASVIEMLGEIDKVKAMTETQYVKLPSVKKGLEEGKIADIGESMALNIEKLMDVSPDIIIVSPFKNIGYGKLETTGIAIVENAGYMENSPLGRTEWIRFIAAFLQKDKEAEEIMKGIAERYISLQEKTKNITNKPTVLSEKRYGKIWDVPGGDSYMAHFYKDAGADYLWKDDHSTGSLALDFETVYEKAENADLWIIKSGQDFTYDDLKKEYEPYSYFKAWKDKKIIFCNTVEKNYYEEGAMNPDYILEDLINFFHPGLLPNHTNRYFEWLHEISH